MQSAISYFIQMIQFLFLFSLSLCPSFFLLFIIHSYVSSYVRCFCLAQCLHNSAFFVILIDAAHLRGINLPLVLCMCIKEWLKFDTDILFIISSHQLGQPILVLWLLFLVLNRFVVLFQSVSIVKSVIEREI